MKAGETQKAARRRLQESELRLKLALRAAQIGIWDWDVLANELTYSARTRAIFGLAGDAPVSMEVFQALAHPDDVERVMALAARSMDPEIRDKEPYEYRVVHPANGEVRWVLAHGEAIFAKMDGKARAIRYIGTVQDITDQKRAEAAIRESEARQRLAIDAARMAVWEVIVATQEVRASPELNRIYGFPDDARPTLADYRAAYGPGEQERLQQTALAALAAGERNFEVEFRLRQPDGRLRWMLLRAEIIMGNAAAPERLIGVLMDIDEKKRAEERQILLARELNHRVRNTLSVVQSLAGQAFRGANARPEVLANFRGQLQALAKANEVLLDNEWTAFSLRALVNEITAPYHGPKHDPFTIDGADAALPPHLNVPLALALHELCTNAAKYGALSTDEGRVHIAWCDDGQGIRLRWKETGGPRVKEPDRAGFGTRLLSQSLSPDLGMVELKFAPDGLACEMVLGTGRPAGQSSGIEHDGKARHVG
jgi:PAS domain S-box-containing protein